MKITFESIAGYKEEKRAVNNIIKVFKDYEKYKEIGIRLPKGLIFHGKPGVGKTLFSKAIAIELKRNFIKLDFSGLNDEDTITNINKVFKEAKAKIPSIVFIDELDKLVPIERRFGSYISDESRANLTLLLELFDGFESNGDIMVIATTNSLSAIPEALTRSGRIDKHIYLSSPDDDSRIAIINHYLNKIDFKTDINLEQVSLSLEGLSGADISTIINQAFIDAVTNNKEEVNTKDILNQTQMILGKNIIKNLNDEDSEILSIHELGHFVVANHFNRNIKDISINQIGKSLGRVRIKANQLIKKTTDLIEEITMFLGGRAAEEVILGNTYLGSRNDFELAYNLIKEAVIYGDFGLEYLNIPERHQSAILDDKTKNKVNEIFSNCYRDALMIVKENSGLVNYLAPLLVEKKILSKVEIKERVKEFEKTTKSKTIIGC